MFDPEKVQRIRFRDNWRDPYSGEYVEAADYDQLLALYNEETKSHIEDLDTMEEYGLVRTIRR